jgi:hypothetical protein
MTREYRILVQYVNAAADLAEQCQADIKNGKKYTSETVSKLAKFITVSASFERILNKVQKGNEQLN